MSKAGQDGQSQRFQRAMSNQVIIAGGGIGGFATALTLHQIGVPCLVVEQAADMRPLGVGINLQPNAIRELMALGFTEDDLNAFGPACAGMGACRVERPRHLCRATRHLCRL